MNDLSICFLVALVAVGYFLMGYHAGRSQSDKEREGAPCRK